METSDVIASFALLISLISMGLSLYFEYFRRSKLSTIYGDFILLSYSSDKDPRLGINLTFINHGALSIPITKVIGILRCRKTGQQTRLVWESFFETKNIGETGKKFQPFNDFLSWSQTLVIPPRGAMTKNIRLMTASEEAYMLSTGEHELKLYIIGGSKDKRIGKISQSLVINSEQEQMLLKECVAEEGVSSESVILRKNVYDVWKQVTR